MADSITAEDLLQPVKNTVAADMFSPLAKEVTLQSAVSQLEKMNLALKNQAKDSDDLRQELEDETKEALDFYKEISSLLEDMEKDSGKKDKSTTARIDKAIKSLAKKSEYTSAKASDPTRKVGEMKGAGVVVTPELRTSSAVEYGNELTDAIKRATQSMVGTVLSGVLGGTDAYRIITKGMIEEQYDFASEMNKIAFRTEGITDSTRDMQKAFRTTGDVVRETGYDLGTLQNQAVRGAKRGLKDSQSIAKIGLGLGKLIGANEQEAASLSDTFFDWNQKLGLSKTQLSSIAQEIKDVSRYTGLVGENLASAVKSSEKYLEKMRSAGNLTSLAVKNTITLQAESQKLGIDNEIADAMNALTSKDDFFKASNETKTLLLQAANFAGETKNLLDGTILNSKSSIKGLSRGLEEEFKVFSGGIDIKDINKLNPEQKSLVDLKLKRATGKGIGDFERIIPLLQKAGATFSDKMNDINNDLKNASTAEEKLTLERKKQDLYLTESMSNSSVFAEAAKNATSLEDAVFRMQNTMNPDQIIEYNKELASVAGTFSEDLKARVLTGDKTAIAEAINLSAADAIKKAGGGDYTQRVKSAISNKDTKKLISLQERMNKEQQKLGIKDATIGDPIERATDQIKLMNENLIDFTGPAVMWAAQTAGSTGIMAGLMALIVAQGYFGAESIRAWGEVFMGGFKSLKDTFAKGVAENATEVISPMAEAMATASAPIAGAARVSPMTAAMATASAPVATTGLAAGTGATMGATTTAGTAATLTLGTVALGIAALGAAVGALTGSYWAGQEAATHFNTEIEDLTMSQLYASKGAGLLTGALNVLTLGIFNNWLGATGSLTAMLARFNEKLPILSAVAGLLDVVFGAFYGVYKLIVNLFSGIIDGIMLAFSPIVDVLASIVDAVSSVIAPFTSLNETVAGTGSLITVVSDLIGGIGTVIGGIAKGIGFLIKMILTPFAYAISAISKVLATLYRIVLSPLLMVVDGLKDAFFGVIKTIKGILAFDFGMIFEGWKQQLLGAMKFVAGILLQVPIRIFTALKEIGPMILSIVSSIGKVYLSILKTIFYEIPKFIISSVMSAFTYAFVELPSVIASKISSAFTYAFIELPSIIKNTLINAFNYVFVELPNMIINAIKYAFVELPRYLWDSIYNGLKSLTQNDLFGPIFEPILDAVQPLYEGIVAITDAFSSLLEPFKGIFSAISSNEGSAKEGISLMGMFATGVRALSTVIGGFLKVVLFPLKFTFEILGGVLKFAAGIIGNLKDSLFKLIEVVKYTVWAIINPFEFLYDVLVGHSIIPDLVSAVINCFYNMTTSVLKGLFSFVPQMFSLFGKVESGISGIAEGAINYIKSTDLYSMLSKKFKDAKGAVGEFFSSIMSGFDFVKSGWDWLFGKDDKVANTTSKAIENSNPYSTQIVSEKSSKSAELYSNYTSPSQLVTPENAVKPASVQPTGYVNNVYDKVRRNKVEENMGSSKGGSVHLSELVVINNEMLHYMMMNEQNTAKLVELLTSTGSLSGETNGQNMKTKGNSKPRNSSNYNQWQFGRYDQNASLQVVTTGV
jgi:phage-related protein